MLASLLHSNTSSHKDGVFAWVFVGTAPEGNGGKDANSSCVFLKTSELQKKVFKG